MKQLTTFLSAICATALLATSSPAFALLSLAKTTVNNASGNQTPNCLLSGWFEYNVIGDIAVQTPTNATSGQFAIVTIHSDATHAVTWPGNFAGVYQIDGFWNWQGYFFNDAGTWTLVAETYY